MKQRIGFVLAMLVFLLTGNGVFPQAESLKQTVIGTWKLYDRVPRGDFSKPDSEIIFHPDGTATESMSGVPGAKWRIIENEIIELTIDKKKIYLLIHDYKNGPTGLSDRFDSDKKGYFKGSVLDGSFVAYSSSSPYWDMLKIIYIAKGDDVNSKIKSIWDLGGEKKRMIYDSISMGCVATKEYDNLMAAQEKITRENEALEKMQEEYDKKRIKEFERKWGKKAALAIQNRDVFIGMTTEQVIESIGEPNDRKTIETAKGKLEQWSYVEGKVLLILNGRVNAIQREE